jgi:hypothetical protein
MNYFLIREMNYFNYGGENNSWTELYWSSSLNDLIITFSLTGCIIDYRLNNGILCFYDKNGRHVLDLPYLTDRLYQYATVIDKSRNKENVVPILKIIHDALYPICIQDDFTLEALNEVSFCVSPVKSARK